MDKSTKTPSIDKAFRTLILTDLKGKKKHRDKVKKPDDKHTIYSPVRVKRK